MGNLHTLSHQFEANTIPRITLTATSHIQPLTKHKTQFTSCNGRLFFALYIGYWYTAKQLNSHWMWTNTTSRQNNNAEEKEQKRLEHQNWTHTKNCGREDELKQCNNLRTHLQDSCASKSIYWNGTAETDLKSVNFFTLVIVESIFFPQNDWNGTLSL